MGWVAFAIVYAIGGIEIYMVRRDVDATPAVRIVAVFTWPVFVVWAILFERRGLYR